MANANAEATKPQAATDQVYSVPARKFHWWMALLIVFMIPLGEIMQYRGNELNIWDNLTNTMYSTHKLVGMIVLVLAVLRLVYRVRHGAPPDEPTLEWWQKVGSHLTHWGIYGLLFAIPLTGWLGVSLYGARDVFGLFSLPPLAAQNQNAAKFVFFLHETFVKLLILALIAHVGAALYHHFIRKDGVLRRMLPGLQKRS